MRKATTKPTAAAKKKPAKSNARADAEKRAMLFGALSASLRIKILDVLAREGEANVTTLVEQLAAEQPNISRHLSILRSAGLVNVRREGLQRIYKLVSPEVTSLIDAAEPVLYPENTGDNGSH